MYPVFFIGTQGQNIQPIKIYTRGPLFETSLEAKSWQKKQTSLVLVHSPKGKKIGKRDRKKGKEIEKNRKKKEEKR